MKKKILFGAATILTIITIGITSFAYAQNHQCKDKEICAPCEGKHCTYTVGCDCPGFSPITSDDVYKQSYCRRCGHHKKYHR